MKTSFPTAPLIKCPSSMSSLRGSSCTTKQKVISGFTGNSSEPDACSALEQVPKPHHLGYGVKITSTLGFVTVKLPLNIFFNYVKGIVLREEHSSYSVASPHEASHLSLPTVPPFVARDTLCAWQEKNHPWLELSDVHRETTENIRVTVIPFYMGMRVGLCCSVRSAICFTGMFL